MRLRSGSLILLALLLIVGTASGATLIVNAAHDGYVGESNPDAVWPTIVAGAGDASGDLDANYVYGGYALTTSTPSLFNYNYRGVVTYDTSALPDDAIITAARISFYGGLKSNGAGTVSLSLIDAFPVDDTNYANGDYSRTTKMPQAPNITYAAFSTTSWNNFTLSNLTTISKTGNTSFMLANSADVWAGQNLSETWAETVTSGYRLPSMKVASGTKKSNITITYYLAPTAAFLGTPTYGDAPLTVTFTDATDDPVSWLWDFGDGTTSTSQNPTHTYQSPGNYTVNLTVTNPAGTDSEVKTDYIMVATAPAACPVNLAAMYNITGNGTDEAPALNAAFIYTRSVGTCKVTFPANAVIRFNSTVNMSENLELDGQNATLKVFDGHGDGPGENMIQTAAHDWWHNLNYNGNNLGIGGSIDYGIKIADWVVMENSQFRNGTEYMIEAFHTSNWVFKNNWLENSTQYGIATGGSSDRSDNATVTGNTVKGMREVGIKIRGTSNSTIDHNTVYLYNAASAHGIRFYTNDEGVENTTIRDNIVFAEPPYSGSNYGITASATCACLNCEITNNTIDGAYYGMGILQTNANSSILIEDNIVRNTTRASVLLYGNYHRFYNNIFDRGIYLGAGSGYNPRNNTFRGNIIQNGTTFPSSPEYGEGDGFFFWAGSAPNTTIDFNRIIVPNHGININSTYGVINGTVITNNVITSGGACILDLGNGTIATNNTCNGVMDPVIVKFTKNKASGNTPLSVTLTDTSTGPTIMSRGWNATNSSSITGGNGTRVTIGSTSPLSVTLTTGNWTVDLTACDAVGACNTTAAQWVNVSGSSVPEPWWWTWQHWWHWNVVRPLFSEMPN